MGIKTLTQPASNVSTTLKNLPTTWGLRRTFNGVSFFFCSLKNLPTTWGLRQHFLHDISFRFTLKNLPTTWGLRRRKYLLPTVPCRSEKPPHHMGIKTHSQEDSR